MPLAGNSAGLEEAPVTLSPAAGVSTSPTVKENVSPLVSSFTLWSRMVEIVGRSFTGLTVSTKLWVLLAPFVSVTFRLRLAAPDWLVAGVMVTVRLLPLPPNLRLEEGKRLVSEEVMARARRSTGVVSSPTVNAMVRETSSSVDWSAMGEITGGPLIPLTVTVKLRLAVWLAVWPSSTVTMIVAVPLALGSDARLSVPVVCGLR